MAGKLTPDRCTNRIRCRKSDDRFADSCGSAGAEAAGSGAAGRPAPRGFRCRLRWLPRSPDSTPSFASVSRRPPWDPPPQPRAGSAPPGAGHGNSKARARISVGGDLGRTPHTVGDMHHRPAGRLHCAGSCADPPAGKCPHHRGNCGVSRTFSGRVATRLAGLWVRDSSHRGPIGPGLSTRLQSRPSTRNGGDP
jgi:hypothetical protein